MTEKVVIIGGGVSGLSAAGFLSDRFDCTLLERHDELGGYCRTIYQDGFTWDYSGHFFHFRNRWIAEYIHRRMASSELIQVEKKTRIFYKNQYVDYPFQYNIHQLPIEEFVACLSDMYDAQCSDPPENPGSFLEMLRSRYGNRLAEIFLIPYNEKLYATDLERIDPDAVGRFFPHTNFSKLLSMLAKNARKSTYNDVFTYPRQGAKAYVDALTSYVPDRTIRKNAECTEIDTTRSTVATADQEFRYDRLITTAPLPSVLRMAGVEHDPSVFTSNKVLVLNLGFDRPSSRPDHWVYYPESEWSFYRVGHYDNILGDNRMSLYVEIALRTDEPVDPIERLEHALADLRRAGVVTSHKLVSWKPIIMDPAYVHITPESRRAAEVAIEELARRNIFALGRYGRWIYCSIEDNILSAHRLARAWGCAADTGPREP